MVQPVALIAGIAGQVYAQAAESVIVYRRQDDRGMDLAVF